MSGFTAGDWDATIAPLPGAHILQTWEWAQFKSAYGWEPLPQVWRDETGMVRAAAMVLRRAVPGGLSVLYVPRGPLVDWDDPVWGMKVITGLQDLARKRRAIFIKIDPELVLGYGVPGGEDDAGNPGGAHMLEVLQSNGWRISGEQVQFRNTVWLDLSGDEEDWLARMKQKARYNLRLAQRKGVTVRRGTPADDPLLYRMYAETSVRDGFVIRPEAYYRQVWDTFARLGMCIPLIAEVEAQPVAALVLFVYAGKAWYIYGMSRDAHREKMPNYLLQWEAMRAARASGALSYDLWGAPDVFDETDPLWGVFRFKEGLGGEVVRTLGAWDYLVFPPLYSFYMRLLPRLLEILRRRGKERTRREVSA